MENKTKYKLSASLRKLLLKKNIDKITIGEIVKDSHVNRQTFYYHFKDIYDLIEWIYMNEIINELKVINDFNDWEASCNFMLNYILKNEPFISKTYKISSLKNFIYDQIYNQIYNKIKGNINNLKNNNDVEFMARFYSHAFIGIVGDWVRDGMHESIDKLISNMSRIINSTKIS